MLMYDADNKPRCLDKKALLKQYFGHADFRPGQEALIDSLLSGRDVLGVMPTGAGKSVCYQLPAMMLPGITLVISPLIALMKDQVAALTQAGIPAAYINSSLSSSQYGEVFRRARNGAYKIIYVAPERLLTEGFKRFSSETSISLVAVDEAHCVSQWGQDFRPSYLGITQFIQGLSVRPRIGAFTATATDNVKGDIVKLLQLNEPLPVTTGFDRPNLCFEVAHQKYKDSYLNSLLSDMDGLSGIVYCATRKNVEAVCNNLNQCGVSATRYHAGLSDEERRQNQDDFVFDRVRVMVATNAFGMGIDKSNVGFVVHYNMPKDVESYYQEAGRAGRDGSPARCVLLYSPGDVRTARYLIENSEENEELSHEELLRIRKRDYERLSKMIAYCKSTGCFRSYLLSYFGEESVSVCGNCGNCRGEVATRDITLESQKILSAVARVEKKYTSSLGAAVIVRMLRGSHEQRVLQLGLDKLSTYGIMNDVDAVQVQVYIDYLIEQGYLTQCGDEFPVLRLTEKSGEVLFNGKRVVIVSRKKQPVTPIRSEKPVSMPRRSKVTESIETSAQLSPLEEELFSRLKTLRGILARNQNVPAYVVFSNAALTDMAIKQPETRDSFLLISGVGTVKADKYAAAFINVIKKWKAENEAYTINN